MALQQQVKGQILLGVHLTIPYPKQQISSLLCSNWLDSARENDSRVPLDSTPGGDCILFLYGGPLIQRTQEKDAQDRKLF
jgi:hypothetical protein